MLILLNFKFQITSTKLQINSKYKIQVIIYLKFLLFDI